MNRMDIVAKYLRATIEEADMEKFIAEVEEVCQKYAGDDYNFHFIGE